jgi:hypothetical protein
VVDVELDRVDVVLHVALREAAELGLDRLGAHDPRLRQLDLDLVAGDRVAV